MMGGYLAENIVMAKDLFRANFKGKVMGFAFGITPAFIDGAGKEAAEGIYRIAEPVARRRLGGLREAQGAGEDATRSIPTSARPTTTPIWRSSSMAKGKDATGTGIRDNIRKIANNDSAHEGRQRARRAEGDRRGQGDQVFGRVRPVQVRRQRQHHRGRVPHHAGEGRQAGRGEDASSESRLEKLLQLLR